MSAERVPVHLNYGKGRGEWTTWPQTAVDALMDSVEEGKRCREEGMPDEEVALSVLHEAHQRLIELGWRRATYAPKDGSPVEFIEAGSTGIHQGYRDSEGRFWIVGDDDVWPTRPILFRARGTDQ